jgi:putative Mn2+ efflux pump MntP
VPWIALVLLCFIGGKMLYEGIKTKGCPLPEKTKLTFSALLLQGVATSIDALSVGFTIAEYNFLMAFVSTAIIAVITFAVCLLGLFLGKKFGTCLSGKAGILGGVILIFIGIEIFITGIF